MDEYYQAIGRLPEPLRSSLATLPADRAAGVWEVRLRSDRPVELRGQASLYPGPGAGTFLHSPEGSPPLSHRQLQECFFALCGQSVHSCAPELRQGFVALPGGHRVGVAGVPVRDEKGRIDGFKTVSSLDLRIARRPARALPEELRRVLAEGFRGLVLAGPPGSGKTTLLRAAAGWLCAAGRTVTVVDERCELFPCGAQGFAFPPPPRCDVLSAWPKGPGILQAVRTLGPEVVLCDELGDGEEVRAVEQGLHAGVDFLLTVHAGREEDLRRRPALRALAATGAFDRLVLLEAGPVPGRVRRVTAL